MHKETLKIAGRSVNSAINVFLHYIHLLAMNVECHTPNEDCLLVEVNMQ